MRNIRLSVAIVAGLIVGMLLPALLTTKLLMDYQHTQKLEALAASHTQDLETLALGLTEPLWNFDHPSAEKLARAVFVNPSILSISVNSSDNESIVSLERKEESDYPSRIKQKDIVKEDEVLGHVAVTVTTALVETEIKENMTFILVTALSQLAVSIALLFFLLQKKVLSPVKILVQQANKLSLRELNEPFVWRGRDELSRLGATLEFARAELKSLFHTIEEKNKELENMNSGLEELVEARTAQIKIILDHVQAGFLLVDSKLEVQPGYTKSCLKLFGPDMAVGQKLTALLKLEKKEADLFAILVDQVYKDLLPESLTTAQLPRRFQLGSITLQLECSCVRDEDQKIAYLLFTVIDVSALRKAEAETATARMLINILKQQEAFALFVNDSIDALENCKACIRQNRDEELRAELHTMKGNAATFGLNEVSELIHRVEDSNPITIAEIDEIYATFVNFFRLHSNVLHAEFQKTVEDIFTITSGDLDELAQAVASLGNVDFDVVSSQWIKKVSRKPVKTYLNSIKDSTETLAKRLGKLAHVVIRGGDVLVEPRIAAGVMKNLVHVLRNAVDHGIEEPWDRGSKPELATIEIDVKDSPEELIIRVCDDGRGIDDAAVAKVALERGIVTQEQLAQMATGDVCRLIFSPAFSTAANVTEVSGRGVGMSALESAVKEVGGSIDLENKMGEGLSIEIAIPKVA